MSDWKPNLYLAFEKERTQPSIDLIARLDHVFPKRIIDIGCGPGNSTNVLKRKWPDAEVIGLDNSEAMIAQANTTYTDIMWVCKDASTDLSELGTFDLIFSNAAIQWMPHQHLLLPQWFHLLNPDGILAVQVPYTEYMPVHTQLQKQIEAPQWKSYFTPTSAGYAVHPADFYYDILSKQTSHIVLWTTDYYHMMQDHAQIVHWYRSTGLKPYLDCLQDEALVEAFLSDFENRLKEVYPLQKNNTVLFPFTRIFFVAKNTSYTAF